MKQTDTNELLLQLAADCRQLILKTNYLLKEPYQLLLQKPSAEKWSVAQIIEHLNSYGRYYLPEMKSAIAHSEKKQQQPRQRYKAGWLGDYFTKMMQPNKQGKVSNRMQSPKDHRPTEDLQVKDVLEEFLNQQHEMLDLLDRARLIDIQKTTIPISISRFIKLQLGDTFRFFITHEQRHFIQVTETLKAVGAVSDRYPADLQAG